LTTVTAAATAIAVLLLVGLNFFKRLRINLFPEITKTMENHFIHPSTGGREAGKNE